MRIEKGFTIIETMIFLTISMVLLVSTAAIFNGTQRRNQFSQSMRDIESKFQDIINDVSTGYFEFSNATCTSGLEDGFAGNFPTFTRVASAAGTNKGCVFLGKAVLLTPNGAASTIEIIPIAGNRLDISGRDVSTHLAAYALPVCCEPAADPVNFTSNYDILWGARVKNARAFDGAVYRDTYAASFLGSTAKFGPSGAESGAQRVVHKNHDIALNRNSTDLVTCYRARDTDPPPACITPPWSAAAWEICFTNGEQDAKLTIGGNTTLTTRLEFVSC